MRIVKHGKSATGVVSQEEHVRLTARQPPIRPRMATVQWLLSEPATGTRDKAEIDAALAEERNWSSPSSIPTP